jgi:hypothetical protein
MRAHPAGTTKTRSKKKDFDWSDIWALFLSACNGSDTSDRFCKTKAKFNLDNHNSTLAHCGTEPGRDVVTSEFRLRTFK